MTNEQITDEEIKEELLKIAIMGPVGGEILNEIAFHSDMCEWPLDSFQYRIWSVCHKLLAPENYSQND